MKKIVILGAGVYQLPLIKRAKKMGHYVIVVSKKGKYPGFLYADKVYYIDTTDIEGIYKIAKEEQIDAITTLGTDVAVRTLGVVNERMGLSGILQKSATLSTDKKLMKETFLKNNIKTAPFKTVFSLQEAYKAYDLLNKPLAIKPVDNSGSRGITKVSKKEDLEKAYHHALTNSKKEYVIVEEYIEGRKLSVEAAVIDKRLVFFLPNGNILYQGKIDIPIGHFVPAAISSSTVSKIEAELLKLIDALEIDNSALNVDLVLHDEEVHIIEAGARAGGTNLADLVSTAYDVNYYDFILNLALGEAKPFANEISSNCAVEVMVSESNGYLKRCSLETDDRRVVSFACDYKIDEYVKKFETGADRIGHIVIKCGLAEDPIAVLDEIKKDISVEVYQ